MFHRRILIAALMLLAPALWVASLATASTPSAVPQAPQATIDSVYGQVLANGQPVSNVNVFLELTAGGVTSNVITATTTITGYYEFPNPPALQQDERYNVVFGPQNDPAYLSQWVGPDILDTDTGTVFGGNLQVADVTLVAPPDNATVTFPVTFQWQPRPIDTESYYVIFLDPETDTGLPSSPVGHTGSLTLNSLTDVPGLQAGKQYAWFIGIDYYDPDNNYNYSYGYSLARRNVTFTGSGTTPTPTATAVSSTETPTSTPTATPVPATETATATATTASATSTPTATATSVSATTTPTATGTAIPPSATPTATQVTAATSTPTATPTGTPDHRVYLPYIEK